VVDYPVITGDIDKARTREERIVALQKVVRLESNVIDEIQTEVLAYLDEHPNAADTVDAIKQWWLLQRLARYSNEKVQQALEQLVHTHLVERKVLGDGREVYARAPRKQVIN
jgi:hypothetical protein